MYNEHSAIVFIIPGFADYRKIKPLDFLVPSKFSTLAFVNSVFILTALYVRIHVIHSQINLETGPLVRS